METTAEKELTEETRVPLKIVVFFVTTAITIVGFYFGLQAQVAAANSRIDRYGAKLVRLQRVECAVAKKVGVDDAGDCLPVVDDAP